MGAVNLYDPTVQDYNTYIRFANQILGTPCTQISDSTSATNRCAALMIAPGKTYIVTGNFDNRFRVGTLKSSNCKAGYVVQNYVFDPLDNNDASYIGDNRTLTITAGDDHDLMLIGYYTSTGSVPFTTIKNSIVVNELTYTVTFDTDGGGTIDPETVTEGGTVTEPTAPTKEGYTFGGWYTDAACTKEWNFADTITADTVLYAKWMKNPEPEPPATGKRSPCFGWQGIFVKR